MSEQQGQDVKLPDPVELTRSMGEIAEKSQKIVSDWLERQTSPGTASNSFDPLNIGGAFLEMTARMMTDPAKLVQAQMSLWQDYLQLWQSTAQRLIGGSVEPAFEPAGDDRRFSHPAWDENHVFDFIKQSYLLSARWVQSTVREVEGLDDKTAKKVDFYTRQFVDAMAPSNFVMTNPEVLRSTMESGGDNLVKGLQNLLDDLERGNGRLHIRMTDPDAFEVGHNIAVTPGKVVYQNDLMQLIQYTPTTEKVYKRPLLIIPPWINKFYILDLREKNSFVKWAVSEGFTVFVISWVNPDAKLAQKTFEDYMLEAPLAALDAIEAATGEREVNVVGYCLGGTLLAATLAVMAVNKDERFKSATFLTSMTDFTEAGELGVFIDEEQLASLEEKMHARGYLEGAENHLQHAARQRPDLVLRGQQLPAGQGPLPLRPAVLERRFDPHARGHAFVLSAPDVSGEPAGRAGRHRAGRRAGRSVQGRAPGLHAVDARRPHRALALDLRRHAAVLGTGQVRARGLGPHRGRGQPPGLRQVRPLDQSQEPQEPGHLAEGRERAGRIVVADLVQVAGQKERRQGGRPAAGRRQAGGHRGRARLLRQGQGARLTPLRARPPQPRRPGPRGG
jgi:hypothetical protein